LPVVDAVAPDYAGDVTFLAVGGRSTYEATAANAAQLFVNGAIMWTYDDSLWEKYEIFGQPVTVLISADGVVVEAWYGLSSEGELRSRIDALIAASA